MTRKLIDTKKNDSESRIAKTYRDAEWQEYRVVFYLNGVKVPNGDYHTTDKVDALETAISWINKE